MDKFTFLIVAMAAIHVQMGKAIDLEKHWRNNFCNNECNNNICQNVADNSSLPNDESCTQFFTCIDGNTQPNTCPKGQWFNPESNHCDSSTNDKCNPKDKFKCPTDGIFFFPHEEFCDKYIMCFAGFPILQHCADGLYYDKDKMVCDKADSVECKLEKCPEDDEKDKIIFLPSDYHCERYYICYNGKPLEQYCAPGIYWNSETDQCDFPENVNCTIEEPEEPELPQPEEIYCKDGIYFEEHPNSCEHYFICAYGYSILLSCAKGFQYDTENYWCNFADNIQSQCDAGKRFVKDSSFVGNDQLLFGTIL